MRQLFIGLALLLPQFLIAQSKYVFSPLQSNQGLSENRVRNINQVQDGRMLIITEGTISLFNGTFFKNISVDEERLASLTKYSGFHHSYVEGKKRLWLKNRGRLIIVDLLKERFESHPKEVLSSLGIRDSLADIFIDTQQNIWFLTQYDKLIYRDTQQGKTRQFLTEVSRMGGPSGALYDLAVQDQRVFLFYNSGLLICIDLKTGKELYRDYAYSQNEQALYDRTLFVTQHKQNLLQLRNGKKGLMLNYDTQSRKWLKILETDYWLNCVSVDKDENIWVSCKKGLWLIDKTLKKRTFLPTLHLVDGRELNNEVSTVFNDNQGGLWIGTLNRGLLYHHPQRFKFKNFGKTLFKGFREKELLVSSFTENELDEILVGTNSGYYKYNAEETYLVPCAAPRKTTPAIKIEPRNSRTPSSVHQVVKWKREYLGISERQLFVYNPIARLLSYPHQNLQKYPMFRHSNHEYNCLLVDSRGLLWFGTQDGLYYWNESEKELTRISRSEGLKANSIKSIIEDKNQNIWLSTSNGAAKIVLKKAEKYIYTISSYNKYDGLIEDEFIERSAFVTKDGRLLMGGIDGFNELNTSTTAQQSNCFNPVFSDFQLYGKSVNENVQYDGNVILKSCLASTEELSLKHNQNFFTVSFSALNYINPTQTYFRYTLDGVDPHWQELSSSDGSGHATYTSLAPGTYVFKVQATDNSKTWTGKASVLRIIIEPPFWNTGWAHMFYFIVCTCIGYCVFRFYSLKSRKKLALEQKEKLDEAKFNFFTNMSHELRTPLTLIISPLEAILKKQEQSELKDQLEGVHRNAGKLLQQVTQLLDFRKMELHSDKLNLSYCDISEYLIILCRSFQPLADRNGINFVVPCNISGLYAYLDKDKFSKIINNLLSNAFKFTKRGTITVKINKIASADRDIQYLSVEVADTGIGIPVEEQQHIFERFRQAGNQGETNTGAGIGLYLVMEYVKLHQGEARLESMPGKGSKFTITIALNLTPEGVNADHVHGVLKDISDKKLKVLIVEDNAEFRAFLSGQLRDNYQVIEALNGRDGLEKSFSDIPDLVVTDLMMPEMNGLELCSALKADLRTSHVPVILLTARSSDDIQFEGYHAGADAFISKPFNTDILLLRIRKLIEQQEHRKLQFKQSLIIQPGSMATGPVDEKLMIQVLECVERNLANCDYSVEQLSSDMNMDRTGLYRKLLALTGLNPTLFIRSVRLKKAASLLQQKELNISEIADKVGFKTVPYFSKCFQDEFGVKPSQFTRSLLKEMP